MSRRTEMAYKAQSPGKVAPFDSAHDMVSLSNHVAKVHVLIRGDLSNGAAIIAMGVGLRAISKGVEVPPNPTAIKAAHHVATYDVIGQKSAEAIVAQCLG